jgi:hypothetical protein
MDTRGRSISCTDCGIFPVGRGPDPPAILTACHAGAGGWIHPMILDVDLMIRRMWQHGS